MPQFSPEELVRWCQQTLPDDTRAFEHLMTQYKGFGFTIARRLMGNHEDAEDQTQDVFVNVATRIHTLDAPATLSGWISRIAINTCLNRRKRQKRLRADSLTPLSDGPDDIRLATNDLHTLPESATLTRELRACLEDVLHSLHDAERTVIVLRDIEGSSYQEVSERLHANLGTVKMRIRRARLAFQQLFQEHCPEIAEDGTRDMKKRARNAPLPRV